MKYLIMGVNGMAGHTIALYLSESGHAVTGFAREKSLVCETIIGDAEDEQLIADTIERGKYDVVINCIGMLNKAVDENLKLGIYINSYLPYLLSEVCHKSGSKFIHISSDCVFSGDKGSYIETDIPDATSYYGRTKFLGEAVEYDNLIIRTSIIGPELKSDGIGLFHWFMKQSERVCGYKNVLWSGVTTLELAGFIEHCHNVQGLYFLSNNQKIAKYDLLQLFNQYCRIQKIDIQVVNEPCVDKTLICTRDDVRYVVPDYKEMIKKMSDWIKRHEELYRQYLR